MRLSSRNKNDRYVFLFAIVTLQRLLLSIYSVRVHVYTYSTFPPPYPHAVKSFVEMTRYLLSQPGEERLTLLSERFSQDPLENYFGKQRARGGILLSRSHCRMQLRSVHSARWSWIVYKVTAGGRGVSLMTNHLGLTALHCRSGNGHQKHDCMHDILYLCVAPYVVTIIIIILNKLS